MMPSFINKLKNNRFFNHFIITLTILIISILVYTTYHIYTLTLEENKNSHQEKQLELAKSAASSITYYLKYLNQELEYLSTTENSLENFQNYYQNPPKSEIVKTVFEIDEEGNLRFSNEKPFLSNFKENIITAITNNPILKKGLSIYSDVYNLDNSNKSDSLYFFMLIQKNKATDKEKDTYLGYLISFDWLINHFVQPLKLTKNDFAWILDDNGRLLYHPSHQEMLFRSIVKHEESCQECHASFEVQNQMLIKKTSVDEYHIIGEPKKIMAYVPIELNENFWILSISTYLPSVITNVRDNFLLFFLLSSVAIILISIMGFILYTINLKRIRAEESGRFLEESRSFQEKMNHAAKLASIGELVDNVAHEINTPTGIISAEADVLYLQNCNPKNCCEELDIIKEQTRRIRNYTKSLLNYSRRMPFMPEKNNITELIDECIFLLSPRIRANQVEIIKNIENNIPEFVFDKGRIEQVIINILNNAIDSIDNQNEKTISVSLKEKTEIDSENKFIQIAIADKGIGIPVENIDKIFDPFFSTKSTDQGTGLGLSISKAIIKRHNGNLKVESKINEGTTFIVELPFINNGRYN